MEDKNCSLLSKPYYSVTEAAAYWCNITDREVYQGEDGLPQEDRLNPCLRKRGMHIMDAINDGELRCGRDGKPVESGEYVAPRRRTVRHQDLKAWILRAFPEERPLFLFNVRERRAATGATDEKEYLALQAELERLRSEHERCAQRAKEIADERDALKEPSHKLFWLTC